MKTIRLSYLSFIAMVLITMSCQKDAHSDSVISPVSPATATPITAQGTALSSRGTAPTGPCNSTAYTVVLESRTLINANWEWIWSVQNSNPGNGNNGTVQNLSHWGMQLSPCVPWTSVTGASYSSDGITWTGFTPAYQSDPSQGCMTMPTLKFDYGTTGSAKSYYKLVLNQEYVAVPTAGYYKSGANTGCCTFVFSGIGCGGDDDIR